MSLQPIDWHRVFSDLQRCGVPLRQVAKEARVSFWQCYNAYRSVTPESKRSTPDMRHGPGERVLDVWSKVTRRSRDEAPKLR